MKRFILAALVTVMTVPAFANVEGAEQGNYGMMTTPLDESTIDQAVDAMDPQSAEAQDEEMSEEQDLTQRWRRGWICYARDIFGRTYDGRANNRWYAQRLALNVCRRYGGFICRSLGCRRVGGWWPRAEGGN